MREEKSLWIPVYHAHCRGSLMDLQHATLLFLCHYVYAILSNEPIFSNAVSSSVEGILDIIIIG